MAPADDDEDCAGHDWVLAGVTLGLATGADRDFVCTRCGAVAVHGGFGHAR